MKLVKGRELGEIFSPDGAGLITIGKEGSAVWNAMTGGELFSPRIPPEVYTPRSLSPDGSRFVVAAPDGTIGIFEAETGDELHALRGHAGPAVWLGFLRDGGAVGALGPDRSFRVWDAATGEKRLTVEGPVRWGDFGRDPDIFVTSGGDRTAKLWDGEGRPLTTFYGHTAIVEEVMLSEDGRLVASADRDGAVKVWSTDTRREVLDARSGVLTVALSPDGSRIATGHWDARVRVWNAATGRLLFTVKRYFQHVRAVVFRPDGELIAAAGGDGIIEVFSAVNGRRWLTLEGHGRLVSCLAFSPDGAALASGGNDQAVRIWNVRTGELSRTLEGHADLLTSVAFSPDGGLIVSGSWDRTARVWDATKGTALGVLSCDPDYVHTVAFSSDGRRIATAGEKTVRIWHASSGALETSFQARSLVHDLEWSPDGSRLALVSGENDWGVGFPSVDIWDPVNRRELLTMLRADSGFYYDVAFAADGRRILAGGWRPSDNAARLLEAFPWREEDYPGSPSEPLRTRIEWYARRYWRDRLNAACHAEQADRTPRELEFDRSMWPARDPSTPPNLIDLSEHYNGLLTVSWYSLGNTYGDGNDLGELARGTTSIAGTLFDVRGVVQLASGQRMLFPEHVRIPVGRAFRRLVVLHATVDTAREGEEVGSFVLHDSSGEPRVMPIVYGRNLLSWHAPRAAADAEPRGAVVAWKGRNRFADSRNLALCLFKSTFENPRPDSEVRSIDFLSRLTPAAPFLVAVTVEE